jgi:hypothetical protein
LYAAARGSSAHADTVGGAADLADDHSGLRVAYTDVCL